MRMWLWALPLLLTLPACKGQRVSQAPEHNSSSSSRRVGKRDIKPIEICEHLADMVAAEAGLRKPPIDEQLMNECASELAIEAGIRGTDNWNAIAGCVLQSRDKAELEYCHHSYPLPSPAGAIVSDGSRELEVCEHMIEVMMLETAAQSGEVPQLSSDERGVLEEDCARTLVAEQKPMRSDDAYRQLLECIERAPTSELMHTCE